MALNFTVSYTFSPSTTISSSQVNTNTSDVAAVFQGLEAETKTLAKLKMDVDPTLALEVATKQYVDHYSTWRRPVLQFGSITTVAVESGLDGTNGDIPMLFPDGTMRTETSTTRTTFNITRNAVLVTSGAQSGLTGATSEAANTWYALYACKVTDSSTLWVTVGSTVLPLQANYGTLNTAYGTNGWVYLGLIRNGNGLAANSDICTFTQIGNTTIFNNTYTNGGVGWAATGIQMAATASATSLTWADSPGTGTTQRPNNVTGLYVMCDVGLFAANLNWSITDNVVNVPRFRGAGNASVGQIQPVLMPPAGILMTVGAATALDISLIGFIDGVLGVGSNPLL